MKLRNPDSRKFVDTNYLSQLVVFWRGSTSHWRWATLLNRAFGRADNASILRWQRGGWATLRRLFAISMDGELQFKGNWSEEGWIEVNHALLKSLKKLSTRHDVSTFLLRFQKVGLIERKHELVTNGKGEVYKRIFIRFCPWNFEMLNELKSVDKNLLQPQQALNLVEVDKVPDEAQSLTLADQLRDEAVTSLKPEEKIKGNRIEKLGLKGLSAGILEVAEKDADSYSYKDILSSSSLDEKTPSMNKNTYTSELVQEGMAAPATTQGQPAESSKENRHQPLRPGHYLVRYLNCSRTRKTRCVFLTEQNLIMLSKLTHAYPDSPVTTETIRLMSRCTAAPEAYALTPERLTVWVQLQDLNADSAAAGKAHELLGRLMTTTDLDVFLKYWFKIWVAIQRAEMQTASEDYNLVMENFTPEAITMDYEYATRDQKAQYYTRMAAYDRDIAGYVFRQEVHLLPDPDPVTILTLRQHHHLSALGMPAHLAFLFMEHRGLLTRENFRTLPVIGAHVAEFLTLAVSNPWYVTSLKKLGCDVDAAFRRIGMPVPNWEACFKAATREESKRQTLLQAVY